MNLARRTETHTAYTSYIYFEPEDLIPYSGHGQDWYELNVSISAPGIPVESYYNVEITGFQIQGYANFYSNDIWFNWDTGRFEGRLFSRTNMNFGSLRINYTYLGY